MEKILLFTVLIIAVVSLNACGNDVDEQNVKTDNTNAIVVQNEDEKETLIVSADGTEGQIESATEEDEQSGNTAKINSKKDKEIELDELPDKKPEILHFVDVFGEKYEVEINDNITKTPYDDHCFERIGDHLSYDDNTYSSRMGVDVSRHQGVINWSSVREAGIEFAFIRIGYRGYGKEGSINLDQQFDNNIRNAQKEGIDVGVYFFAQAINEEEAKEEAEFVINSLNNYDLQLPVVYDPESRLDAPARTDNVTAEQFTKNTEAFCSMIKEAGYEPMIYSNMLWEAYELDLEKLAEYPIWYADYEEFPQTPYMYEFWQYSNEGCIKGISGGVDLDIQFIKK